MLTTNVFRPDLVRFVRSMARQMPTVLHGCNDLGLAVPRMWNATNTRSAGWRPDTCWISEHRNFACLRYSRNLHALRRLDGFREALREAGEDCIDLEMLAEHGNGVGEWFRRQLPRLPQPLGLFAEDDLLAARVIEVGHGRRVAGAGRPRRGRLRQHRFGLRPRSRAHHQHRHARSRNMAYQAAAMLDALMSGEALPEPSVVFPPVNTDRAQKHGFGGRAPATGQTRPGLHG